MRLSPTSIADEMREGISPASVRRVERRASALASCSREKSVECKANQTKTMKGAALLRSVRIGDDATRTKRGPGELARA
jgi:hypothetical protein